MNTLPTPPAVAAPFAALGSARNSIPNLTQTAFGGATLQQGFPPETSVPISNGGIPPSRKDLNGMGYIATFPQYFLQMGGYYTYDPNVANAIGGYPYGAVLTYYASSGGEVRKLRSMIPNNKHNFVTSPGVIGNYWEDVTPVVGVGRTMFEFFWNYTKEIPAGALWLNGTNLSGCNNPNSPYYDFYTEGKRLAAAGKLATKTMAEYKTELKVNDTCNAFVFDQNNDGTTQAGRMRIPRINHHFIEAISPESSAVLGSKHIDGLPNITGTFPGVGQNYNSNTDYHYTATGAFSTSNTSDDPPNGVPVNNGARRDDVIAFNASRSNAIYGRSTRVQPQSIELIPCIQYAKGVGNAGGGSTSGGITPGQASSIASQIVESGSFNCSGQYAFLQQVNLRGGYVARVESGSSWAESELTAAGLMIRRDDPSAKLGMTIRRGANVTPPTSSWVIREASVRFADARWDVTSYSVTWREEGNDGADPAHSGPTYSSSGAYTSNYITSATTGEYPPYGIWPTVNGVGTLRTEFRMPPDGVMVSGQPNPYSAYSTMSGTASYYVPPAEDDVAYVSCFESAWAAASQTQLDIRDACVFSAAGGATVVSGDMWTITGGSAAEDFYKNTVASVTQDGVVAISGSGFHVTSAAFDGINQQTNMLIDSASSTYFGTGDVRGQVMYLYVKCALVTNIAEEER